MMKSCNPSSASAPRAVPGFELRFRSMGYAARGYAFECDAQGHVALDELSESIRRSYLYARMAVGHELYAPVVIPVAVSGREP